MATGTLKQRVRHLFVEATNDLMLSYVIELEISLYIHVYLIFFPSTLTSPHLPHPFFLFYHIPNTELAEVLTALGQSPSEEDIEKMMKEVDADANGSIEFPEFLKMMASRHRAADNEEEIGEAFKVFADSSGEFITIETLKKSMSALKENFGDSDIKTMITISGTDGKVSYSQFKNMMLSR